MRRSVVVLAAVGLVVATWAPVAAESEPAGLKGFLGNAPGTDSVSISSHLLRAAALAEAGNSSNEIGDEVPVVRLAGKTVEVELRYDVYSDGNVGAAEAAGLEVTGQYPDVGWVTGRIAPSSISALADIPGLATVHPLYGATTSAGSVENQADVSMRVDQARAVSGLDGSGVEIGVLSDSFDTNNTGVVSGSGCNQTISGTASQNSGDLPASVGMLEDFGGGLGIDEGRGMAELLHDLVPGAEITFHTALNTEAAFAQGIQDLADCGADVIVDDIIYFAEPMFQDGVVAQAADSVALAGIPYFSAAGNQADFGVDDTYVDIDPGMNDTALGDDFHDFGGGDAFAQITLGPGEGVQVVLQWNDPFDGTLGAGALSDYDVGLFDGPSVNSNLLTASATFQGCGQIGGGQGGDPLEIMAYTNPGPGTKNVYLVIDQFCAAVGGGDHLRLATYGTTTPVTALDFEAGIFTDSQQYGHPVAENARSVAAVFYGEIDDRTYQAPGNQIDVEPFSSLGGDIPIYFDAAGNPLPGGPQTRFKPEIAAADGTNTTFFGADDPFDPDGDPNFFGTSAAAPHAAAVAALILDGNPNLTSAEVYSVLQTTAIDIEEPGVDPLSGYGLVDGLGAVAFCNGVPATIVGTLGDDNLTGTGGADVIVTFDGNDTVDGKGGNDLICLGAGADMAEGGGGADTIFGEDGNDTLLGGKGKDHLDGGAGKDTVDGGDGADTIDGGGGQDTIDAGKGNDVVDGGGGDDTVKGQGGADDMRGGGDDDTLSGGGRADTIRGGSGNDTLNGNKGNDTLLGGSGSDAANGGPGADSCVAEVMTSC